MVLWLVLLPTGFLLLPMASGLSIGALLGVTSWPALVNLARFLPVLRLRPLRWLGERSYSIYLTHSPVYMALNIIVFSGSAVPESLTVPTMLIGWILVLAVSDLSYRFLETPSRRWLRRALGDRSQPAATPT